MRFSLTFGRLSAERLLVTFLLRCLLIGVAVLSAAGCSGDKRNMMPTPTLYTYPDFNPFAQVPTALQGDKIQVMYITDRAPEESKSADLDYGNKRSRSAAFGVVDLKIGESLSWDDIVQQSRVAIRDKDLTMSIESRRELARFDPTPRNLVISAEELARGEDRNAVTASQAEAEKKFLAELSARLAKTPRKEVFIFVHGYSNSFEDGIDITGELWHFLGREGVPISYSWPSGHGTSFREYQFAVESSEFTVYHFKQALRLIASCPDVQKINILAHSRGTAVASSAARELYLELRSTTDVAKELKLGTVILAAPDMDVDVVIARDATERVARAADRCAVYCCNNDKALGISNWLRAGSSRLGDLSATLLTKEEIDLLRHSVRQQLIYAQGKTLGGYGHNYYAASPAVSSDIIMLMRYQLPPGAEYGRPLGISNDGMWTIDDQYPGPTIPGPLKSLPR